MAVAIAEVDIVSHGEVEMIYHRAAHLSLMVIVAHRILVSECLQIGGITIQHVQERHRRPAFGNRRDGIPTKGVQIIQASGGIAYGRISDE